VRWLSPLHSSVEDQLCKVLRQRDEHTLQWARNMREFQNWRLGKGEESSQILWIRGPPGFGKSTLAGYFVEMIHHLYPDSIVAYFFCLSGAEGLVKVRDIIRSLACQISRADTRARDFLLQLKEEGEVLDNHGVDFLFEKVLLGSMNQTQKDVFLILDGLDEADTAAIGNRSGKTEMEIFLQSLGTTSARLLFISRPDLNVSEILSPHHTTIVQVGMTQNSDDIEKYVDNVVTQSKRLRALFKEANIEPVKYFLDNSNGIFLWVAVALQELQRLKSVSDFENQIQMFARSSGSMDLVYTDIINKLEPNSTKWIAEILRWVVAAEGQLLIVDLRDAVEHAAGEKLLDFDDFIDVDCGSLLQRTPGQAIQLIHVTLRSFLLDSTKCPSDFYIDEKEIHVHMASVCLDYLAKLKNNTYIQIYWVAHLRKATELRTSIALLKPLSQLFGSQGLGKWIERYPTHTNHYQRSPNGCTEIQLEQDPSGLNSLYDSLKSMSKWAISIESLKNDELTRWAAFYAADRCELLEHLGKVAARVWLFGKLENWKHIERLFLFALKHYRRRKNARILYSELQKLFDSDFMVMCDEKHGNVQALNIAIAYYKLEKWNDSLRWFNIAEQTMETRMYMALAHFGNSNYDEGISISRRAIEENPAEYWAWRCMGMLSVRKEDYSTAIDAFEKAIEIFDLAKEYYFPYTHKLDDFDGDLFYAMPTITTHLLQLYRIRGEHDKAIKMCTRAAEQYPTMSWPVRALAAVFRSNAEHDVAIRILREATENFPNQIAVWKHLRNEYDIMGDCVREVEAMKEAIEKNPTYYAVYSILLGERYQEWGEYDAAIETFQQAYDISQRRSAYVRGYLVDTLLANGDYPRVITLCQSVIAKEPANLYAIQMLGEAYRTQGCYQLATEVYQEAIKNEIGNVDTSFVAQLFAWLGANLMEKGDIDGAIDAFIKCVDDDSTYQGALRALSALYGATAPAKIIPLLKNRINENPYDEWLWVKLGDMYHAVGSRDASNKAYDKGIEIIKARIGMVDRVWGGIEWIFLIRALKAKGEVEQAMRTAETAVQRHQAEIERDPRTKFVTQISGLVHPQTLCSKCKMPVRGYRFACGVDCPWSVLCGACVHHPSHDPNHEIISIPSKEWVLNRFPPTEPALRDITAVTEV
jgi:tetratricopeptide (TPR) repeat protein